MNDKIMKFAIGSVQFGLKYGISNQLGKVSLNEAHKILNKANDNGINTIDTAIDYGESEKVLGTIGIKDWNVITKLPKIPDSCLNIEEWIYNQVINSLNRLGKKSLYALLLHKPDQLLSNIGPLIYEALKKLKSDGLVQKIGISIYAPEEFIDLFENMKFDLVQSPFSILDRRLLSQGWIEKLKLLDIEIHVRSIFLQGLLLLSKLDRPKKFFYWDNIFNEWHKWLKVNNLTPLEACIRYVSSIEGIDKIIIGVDSADQLYEIINIKNEKLENLPLWPQVIDHKLINPSSWDRVAEPLKLGSFT